MTDQPDPNAPRAADQPVPEQPAADPLAPEVAPSAEVPATAVQPPSPVPPEWNPMPTGYAGATDQVAGNDPAAAPGPPPGWTPPASEKPASKLRVLIPLIVIAGFIGVTLYMTRDNQSADDLSVGQCIDLPTAVEFSTVTKRDCTAAHDAEIVLNVEFTESNDSYPISLTFDRFSDDTCEPAVATYVGDAALAAEEISYGWFYPTGDSWSSGDRTVTCYAYRVDEGKLTQSVKAGS